MRTAERPETETTAYPPAPWAMHGHMWLSVFRLGRDVDAQRPRGIYGIAWVSYRDPSPLTYGELLVARPVSEPTRAVTITDIWVDSPASVAGGRALWAIPKDLADFDLDEGSRGPVSTASWSARVDGRRVATARFSDVSSLTPRVPFKGGTWQPPIDEHVDDATAVLKGTSRPSPCRATWDIAPDGPLGWLAGARQLASFRMRDFAMSFG